MSLALYRTYRPGRLSDVIGQDHVTLPLGRALDSGRAHHAYLFTGPRGCGKTSTARILARSLNCEQGPTSEPCGTCQSCQDLAPNGPGSLDVVELDAATHGLVEDARDLREKAMYAPAASRYKVYIIDEAHQLGPGAANALLKLIEEPPPHLRFVFATTEPDKILATIRSRTHQYPFRLVPLRRLQEHLGWVCGQEGVPADAAALGLVARAAQGSVRDAQSVLGQLIAGAGDAGVTYEDTVVQLGFTDAALLDRVVDALAAGDGAELFAIVEQVVETGTDPRRFATDLLERLRDLIVLHQVPDAAEVGLLDVPDTTLETLRRQSGALGQGQLSRAADLVSAGLSELKGTTAPRLQLELLGARLLLPAADDSESGVLARLDRVERRVAYAAPPDGAPAPAPPAATDPAEPAPAAEVREQAAAARAAASPRPPRPAPIASAPPPPPRLPSLSADTAPVEPPPPPPVPAAEPVSAQPTASAPADLDAIRSRWPAVLEVLRTHSKMTHSLWDGTSPATLHGRVLLVAHPDQGRITYLRSNPAQIARLPVAVAEVTGADVDIDIVLAGAATATAATAQPGGAATPAASEPAAVPEPGPTSVPDDPEDLAAPDDLDADDAASPLALVQRELGGSVVDEFDRS